MLCSSGGPDKKFDAVMKRVRAQQEAQDKANAALQASKAATVSMLIPDAKVDWSKFRYLTAITAPMSCVLVCHVDLTAMCSGLPCGPDRHGYCLPCNI